MLESQAFSIGFHSEELQLKIQPQALLVIASPSALSVVKRQLI
tara:strand:+ start:789 stop:917 length:129 start_codon:yes stop_codon:yes gene_type:complete